MKRNFRKSSLKILAVLLVMILCLFTCETAFADENAATVNIPVYKVITGDTPTRAETFTFRLTAVENAPMPSGSVNGVKAVTVSGAGNTAFGAITYTMPGDYRYTISEVAGSNSAYRYDATVYTLTVQVTWKNEAGGELQAVMYLVKQGGTEKQERAVFTNQYTCSKVIVDPPVKKVISGDRPSTDSVFTFYLKADNTAFPMPAGSSNGLKGLNITGAETKDFGDIIFTEAGTYTYTVYEKDTDVSGYTYDTTIYTMKITVTDENGKLTAVREIKDEKGVTAADLIFTNGYSAKEGPKTGDMSMDYIWWILLGAAVTGMGVALWYRRKRKC